MTLAPEEGTEREKLRLISARDVQRTFDTWLALAKDQEVLVLAALVQEALIRRGYGLRWVKRDSPMSPNRGKLGGGTAACRKSQNSDSPVPSDEEV